jgi:hypothetical protein
MPGSTEARTDRPGLSVLLAVKHCHCHATACVAFYPVSPRPPKARARIRSASTTVRPSGGASRHPVRFSARIDGKKVAIDRSGNAVVDQTSGWCWIDASPTRTHQSPVPVASRPIGRFLVPYYTSAVRRRLIPGLSQFLRRARARARAVIFRCRTNESHVRPAPARATSEDYYCRPLCFPWRTGQLTPGGKTG